MYLVISNVHKGLSLSLLSEAPALPHPTALLRRETESPSPSEREAASDFTAVATRYECHHSLGRIRESHPDGHSRRVCHC